jgi:hypothetical protein
METDESDLEVELDCGPYQLVPWIVQRVSQDPPVVGVVPAGPVQPTLPGMRVPSEEIRHWIKHNSGGF